MTEKISWQSWLWSEYDYWICSELYAVGVASFVGVAIRVGISNAFDNGGASYQDDANYSPFLEIFYMQTYLIPNFLGCFIMGFCIVNTKSIVGVSTPLFKALTTGMCGCITTFSSWMNGAIDISFSTQWYQILIMIMLEFWLTWGAFTMGYGAAKLLWEYPPFLVAKTAIKLISSIHRSYIQHQNNPIISKTPEFLDKSNDSNSEQKSNTDNPLFLHTSNASMNRMSAPRIRVTRASSMCENNEGEDPEPTEASNLILNAFSSRVSVWRGEDVEKTYTADATSISKRAQMAKFQSIQFMKPSFSQFRESNFNSGRDGSRKTDLELNAVQQTSEKAVDSIPEMVESQSETANASEKQRRTSYLEPPKNDLALSITLYAVKNEFYLWRAAFWIVAFILWIILIFQNFVPALQDETKRNTFRGVCLAPLGCWVRWGLSRTPQIKATWPEMNPQTLAANTLAVTFYCFLVVLAGSWDWTTAINDGINGSCSTVSTFFAELHTLYYEKGPLIAFRYGLTTVLMALIVIQIIRGGDSNSR